MLNAPWATETDITCGPCLDFDGIGDLTPFLALASEILYNLTEHAYPGVGSDTIRPPSNCACGWWGSADWSMIGAGTIGAYPFGCRCQHLSETVLPGWPVVDVTEVLIDGQVVDPARYRVDQHQRLVYQPDMTVGGIDRRFGWPLFQRVDQPPTEPGTWQVTYTWGTDPPAGGVFAAGVLACEMAMGCNPDLAEKCRLPRNTVSVSAKNIAEVIADPEKLRAAGETGLPEVDTWLRADRWGRQHRSGTVLAPASRPKHTRRTS